MLYYFCHCMALHVCPGEIFILDSHLTNVWEKTVFLAFCL